MDARCGIHLRLTLKARRTRDLERAVHVLRTVADADGENDAHPGCLRAGEDRRQIVVVIQMAVGVNQHVIKGIAFGISYCLPETPWACTDSEVSRMNGTQTEASGWGGVSKVFRHAVMPARTNPNGSESRTAAEGAITTGERVRVHQTTQPTGIAGSTAHRNEHTEVIRVREGTLEVTHDGAVERAEVGDVVLVAKGSMHSLRNVGSGPASYFVVAVGGDV